MDRHGGFYYYCSPLGYADFVACAPGEYQDT